MHPAAMAGARAEGEGDPGTAIRRGISVPACRRGAPDRSCSRQETGIPRPWRGIHPPHSWRIHLDGPPSDYKILNPGATAFVPARKPCRNQDAEGRNQGPAVKQDSTFPADLTSNKLRRTEGSSKSIHEEDGLCIKKIPRRAIGVPQDLLLLVGGLRLHALPGIIHGLWACGPRRPFCRTLVLLVDLLGIAPLLRLRVFLGMSGGGCQ